MRVLMAPKKVRNFNENLLALALLTHWNSNSNTKLNNSYCFQKYRISNVSAQNKKHWKSIRIKKNIRNKQRQHTSVNTLYQN